jgi:hypothetical protein
VFCLGNVVLPASLSDIYLRSEYRVRLARGGYASIRIHRALPTALASYLPEADAPWGFITAWNPRSTPQPRATNRAAQRRLLAALRAQVPDARVCAGVGVADGVDTAGRRWREPSLFAAGVPFAVLDALMLRFGQHAIVRGAGTGSAELRQAP